ncbi:MAG: hypothetical protein ABJB12_20655 [Pseudomonadota bacterium]
MTRRRKVALALGVATLAATGLFLVSAFFVSDEDGPPTTNTDSSALPNDAARIAFAGQYLDFHSTVTATAFQITYWNNGFAPSDWDFTIVVKTAPAEIQRWTAGLKPGASADVRACTMLQGRDSRLATRSAPVVYGSNRCWRALFAAEGVVCVSCTTL